MASVFYRVAISVTGFLVLGCLAVHGPYGADLIEARLAAAVQRKLQSAGHPWARAEASGQTVLLEGEAPDTAGRAQAVAASLTAVGPGGLVLGAVTRVDARRVRVALPAGPISGNRATAASANGTPPLTGSAASEDAHLSNFDAAGQSGPAAQTGASLVERSANETLPPPAIDVDQERECQAAINRALNGRQLTFRPDSAALSAADRAFLDALAQQISACAQQTIIIEGHTDSNGGAAVNLALSARRANAVKEYLDLANHGGNFVAVAYGETRPIASNQTRAGQGRNRRIEFVVSVSPAEPG